MNIVEFNNVSKIYYRHGDRMLLRNRLQQLLSGQRPESFAAVKNVSFNMKRGESMAIVGPNGAGKSTLLSLVAGLSKADSGSIAVNGRIAALLELGSGFHPDLTGAENVRLNAALLGLTASALANFSTKSSSSPASSMSSSTSRFARIPRGMVMRLAFSVAINMDPDVLLVDEILAVGDSAFQEKCFQKVHEFRNSGTEPALCVACCRHGAAVVR